jgi:hypothetical protein
MQDVGIDFSLRNNIRDLEIQAEFQYYQLKYEGGFTFIEY